MSLTVKMDGIKDSSDIRKVRKYDMKSFADVKIRVFRLRKKCKSSAWH